MPPFGSTRRANSVEHLLLSGRRPWKLIRTIWILFGLVCSLNLLMRADPNATVTGLVTDSSGQPIAGVHVSFTNINTHFSYRAETNRQGIYRLYGLQPGNYRINVNKDGFSSIVKGDVELHVQDEVSINFALKVGSVFESITVEDGTPLISLQSASVSTVVDEQFADNLPMNGRSFQTLIDLTPGVVLTASSRSEAGQFSVNGQRTNANYWTVDGVGANLGLTTRNLVGNGLGGGLPLFSVQGGTTSLVSLDTMREFRIETSSSAPEFGRVPGAQISIVTRPGTNRWHGSLFDYVRNNALDANDWFANHAGLPKPAERQSDFGATFSGPILKDRTFFFFSFEGLRLLLPQTTIAAVPDDASVAGGLSTRENAVPGMKPYLAAFPIPTGPEILAICDPATDSECPASGMKPSGAATFNAVFSNRSVLDDYSLRIDHAATRRLNLFARYNHSPSTLQRREPLAMSTVFQSHITANTATLGVIWNETPSISHDIRLNWSYIDASSTAVIDNFGGATPLPARPPSDPLSDRNTELSIQTFIPINMVLIQGKNQRNVQRQLNLVGNTSFQKGEHDWKFGVDFRRLAPMVDPPHYTQFATFTDMPSFAAGNLLFGTVQSQLSQTLLFRNFSAFAQDRWRILPRLTLTYGVRWDVDASPKTLAGPQFPAVTGFNLKDLSHLALASPGAPPYQTTYTNFAPRFGIAYQLSGQRGREAVIKGGIGVFYDLATQEVGNNIPPGSYPFGATNNLMGVPFPLESSASAAPQISASDLGTELLTAFDPSLQLPHSTEWNVSIQQAIGINQTVSATYLGTAGRRLIQTAYVFDPNPYIYSASLVSNSATSDYEGLQIQFNRRLNRGLRVLASYSWAHSIDTASAGSVFGNAANGLVPDLGSSANRGPSDFDIRHSVSGALTYEVRVAMQNQILKNLLGGWSVQTVVQARSAPPVNVYIPDLSEMLDSAYTLVRPDLVPGIPLYAYGSAYPGGKAFNGTPGAVPSGCPDGSVSVGPFCPPPVDDQGLPLRQGSLGRNALRGFGATQWDFGIHRVFPIRESLALQFRAEMFNVLNHPNFGPPSPMLAFTAVNGFPQFGQSTSMLGRSLSADNIAGGGLDPLYQFGGPRSIQFAIKLAF